MRLILGLDRPTAGTGLVDGKPYAELRDPLRRVGALLDARWVHPNRTARAHLRWLARAAALPAGRVDEVLDQVGLTAVADRRAGAFSLGMAQRLGIAGALLGDPGILLFDEPVNGLDPEGIVWFRHFAQRLAAAGRIVFVSSHLLPEMAQTATQLVVIGRGRLIAQDSTAAFVDAAAESSVLVRTPQPGRLAEALAAQGIAATDAGQALTVRGVDTARVGEIAATAGVVLHELALHRGSLEDAFIHTTGREVEFAARTATVGS